MLSYGLYDSTWQFANDRRLEQGTVIGLPKNSKTVATVEEVIAAMSHASCLCKYSILDSGRRMLAVEPSTYWTWYDCSLPQQIVQ